MSNIILTDNYSNSPFKYLNKDNKLQKIMIFDIIFYFNNNNNNF